MAGSSEMNVAARIEARATAGRIRLSEKRIIPSI
jgi:hypothetical protein